MLREISWTEKDILYELSYVEYFVYKKQIKVIDTENKLMVARGGWWGWEKWMNFFCFFS